MKSEFVPHMENSMFYPKSNRLILQTE